MLEYKIVNCISYQEAMPKWGEKIYEETFLFIVKTVSPKRVVTIDNSYAHFLTISGHFFANHINIFHKTEVQWSF